VRLWWLLPCKMSRPCQRRQEWLDESLGQDGGCATYSSGSYFGKPLRDRIYFGSKITRIQRKHGWVKIKTDGGSPACSNCGKNGASYGVGASETDTEWCEYDGQCNLPRQDVYGTSKCDNNDGNICVAKSFDGFKQTKFDWLIVAAPQKDVFNGDIQFKHGVATVEEYFVNQRRGMYTTTLVDLDSPDYPAKSFLNNLVENNKNALVAYRTTDVTIDQTLNLNRQGLARAVTYQLTDEFDDIDQDTLAETLDDLSASLSATGVTVHETIQQFATAYFPRFDKEDIGKIWEIQEFNLDNEESTWHIGSSVCLESVLDVVNYNIWLLGNHDTSSVSSFEATQELYSGDDDGDGAGDDDGDSAGDDDDDVTGDYDRDSAGDGEGNLKKISANSVGRTGASTGVAVFTALVFLKLAM